VTRAIAIAQVAEAALTARPHDAALHDAAAVALEECWPVAAEKARQSAALLREADRQQLVLHEILTAASRPAAA